MNPCTLVPWLCTEVEGLATTAADTALEQIAKSMLGFVDWVVAEMVFWLLIDSIDVGNGAAGRLQSALLPLTTAVLVAGLIWQGLLMTITRRGQPLLQAVKGLWTTALWGAIAVAGTVAALKAGDEYSCWVLVQGLGGPDTGLGGQCSAGDVVNEAIKGEATTRLKVFLLPQVLTAPLGTILIGLVIALAVVIQVVLMVFRNGAVLILAGVVQLAAAGTATRGTSGWLRKVLAWMLALVAYKPVAATVYATAFLLINTDGTDPRTFFYGLGMLALSVIALPALMRFFNWGVGAVGGDGVGGHTVLGFAYAGTAAASVPERQSASQQASFVSRALPDRALTDGARTDRALPDRASARPPGPATTMATSGRAAAPPGTATAFAPPAGTAPAAARAAPATAAAGSGAAGSGAAGAGAAAAAAPIVLGVAAASAGVAAAKKATTNAMGTDEER